MFPAQTGLPLMLFLSLAVFCSHPELLLFLLLCFFLVVIFFKYLLFIYLNLKKKRGGGERGFFVFLSSAVASVSLWDGAQPGSIAHRCPHHLSSLRGSARGQRVPAAAWQELGSLALCLQRDAASSCVGWGCWSLPLLLSPPATEVLVVYFC